MVCGLTPDVVILDPDECSQKTDYSECSTFKNYFQQAYDSDLDSCSVPKPGVCSKTVRFSLL